MYIGWLHILYFEKYEKRKNVVLYMSLVYVWKKSLVTKVKN